MLNIGLDLYLGDVQAYIQPWKVSEKATTKREIGSSPASAHFH